MKEVRAGRVLRHHAAEFGGSGPFIASGYQQNLATGFYDVRSGNLLFE